MTHASEHDAGRADTGAMRHYGGLSLARSPSSTGPERLTMGSSKARPVLVSHEVLADGYVRIRLPAGGLLTDSEARRLAWAILSDLAPDDVVGTPEVVTYVEAQRLATLRALGVRPSTAKNLSSALGWPLRVTQRRLQELVSDGRVVRARACQSDKDTTYSVAVVS